MSSPDQKLPRTLANHHSTLAKRELRDSGVELESPDMSTSWQSRKRSASNDRDEDNASADSGSHLVENSCFNSDSEDKASSSDNMHEDSIGESTSDSGIRSVERSEETPRQQRPTDLKMPSTPDPAVITTTAAVQVRSIDKYKSEGAIELRMAELRHLYRQSLTQYRKITESMGCLRDPPFHRAAERRLSSPGAGFQSGFNDGDFTRRSKRQATTKNLSDNDDDIFGRRGFGDTEERRQRSPTQKAKDAQQFSTKPTAEEIVIDGNGHKSYKCLVCPRKFTHPPAFSQHKRSHGREQAAAAALAAAQR